MELHLKMKFGNISVNELNRSNTAYAFCIFNNRRCFLVGDKRVLENLPTRFPVNVEEQVKIKLIDQVMQMQKGRVPQKQRRELRSYWCVKQPIPKAGRFVAYEIV